MRGEVTLTVAVLVVFALATEPNADRHAAPPDVMRSPRVLVDEGHNNFHTSTGGYATYMRLLRHDGFEVVPLHARITRQALAGGDLLVIVSPLSEPRDTLVRKAQEANEPFEWSAAASRPAFSSDEVSTIKGWVHEGGALLLALDHAPDGMASGPLAAAFGVETRNVVTRDSTLLAPSASRPTHIMFTRRQGSLGEHAVLTGVDSVVTYTGESLAGPPGSTALLRLSSAAVDREWIAATRTSGTRSAAGRAQAIALEDGRGRVIVLGEAGLLTTEPGSNRDACGRRGIAQSDIGNRRFGLNIARWLARRDVDAAVPPMSSDTACAQQGGS